MGLLAKPTTCGEGEWLTSRRNFVWRACARSGRPIRSAHWYTAQEAVDPFSSFLRLKDDQWPAAGRRLAGEYSDTLPGFLLRFSSVSAPRLPGKSHGDAARKMVVARVPMLAWLLSVSATKPQVVACNSPDPMQQLEPLRQSRCRAAQRETTPLPSKNRWPRTLRHCCC